MTIFYFDPPAQLQPVNKNSISYRSTTKVKLFFYAFIFLRNIFFASLPSAFPQISQTSKKKTSSDQRVFLFAVLVALAGESVLHLQVRPRKLTIKSLVSSPSETLCSLQHLHRVKWALLVCFQMTLFLYPRVETSQKLLFTCSWSCTVNVFAFSKKEKKQGAAC